MAYQIVDQSGLVLLGSSSGSPSSYFAGTGMDDAQLQKEIRTAEVQCIGDTYSQTDVVGRKYRVTVNLTRFTTDTSGVFAVGDGCYVTYQAQGDTPTTLFAGLATVDSASDVQRQGDYAKQTISLTSSGAPDVG